jgi:hypothetical protein
MDVSTLISLTIINGIVTALFYGACWGLIGALIGGICGCIGGCCICSIPCSFICSLSTGLPPGICGGIIGGVWGLIAGGVSSIIDYIFLSCGIFEFEEDISLLLFPLIEGIVSGLCSIGGGLPALIFQGLYGCLVGGTTSCIYYTIYSSEESGTLLSQICGV